MVVVDNLSGLQQTLKTWRQSSQRIAFVPTMGNLHAGHLQLVTEARQLAERVVVSIFVNPSQFGVGEDYASYPRTEQDDIDKLKALDVDLVFMPSVAEMYLPDAKTTVSVNGISDNYCGAFRPGHFAGVATVVCKLFNMVQPDVAVFGLKDFQQLAVIRTMVKDLNMPVQIVGVDTVREASGLAMSSRNGYLSDGQKAVAASLYQSLLAAKTAVLAGVAYEDVEQQSLLFLQQAGFQPDYFSICRSHDLAKATEADKDLVLLVAAKLGSTRLIDNICFTK
jgi:pantoate--beta-alanine ligase